MEHNEPFCFVVEVIAFFTATVAHSSLSDVAVPLPSVSADLDAGQGEEGSHVMTQELGRGRRSVRKEVSMKEGEVERKVSGSREILCKRWLG